MKARRTDKITATIRQVEHTYRDLIAELRLFPVSAHVLRELWVYSKHGTYQFFRIHEAGLTEIDQNWMQPAGLESTAAPEIVKATNVEEGNDQHACPERGGREIFPEGTSLP